MKAKRVLLPLLILVLALPAGALAAEFTPRPAGPQGVGPAVADQEYGENPEGLGLAFVTYLSGEALLRSTEDDDWTALAPNLSLRIGDRLWAQDDARIEVRFPLGATAWVSYRSELDITRLERGSRVDTIQLALVSGEGTFDVKDFSRAGSIFQLDLGNASIRAFEAARFRVNSLSDGTVQIGVERGPVVLETPDGLTDLQDGRMAELRPDGRIALDFLPASDAWDSWVQSRAATYDRPAASERYLPPEMASFAYEYDTSGRWVSMPTYGYVWVPAVAPGWSPYSNGRWVWQAGDYVWLSFDPWYSPFHYGRWNWSLSVGWFWVVPRGRAYWSPGYVAWTVREDDICWLPLGYNEVYYGHRYYGPGSVNVSHTNVVNVTNVYVNSLVRNAVMVVRKDNFLRGRISQGRISAGQNPFQGSVGGSLKILGRSPAREIKPIRETRQARPEFQIKKQSLPPVRLERESRSIKQRIVVPAKEKSVFKPGLTPRLNQNIQREKQLEQWVPPKQPTTRTPGAGSANQELRYRDTVPGTAPPPAVQLREGQGRELKVPFGNNQFRRMLEPQGGAEEGPAPTFVPKVKQNLQRGGRPSGEQRKGSFGTGSGDRD